MRNKCFECAKLEETNKHGSYYQKKYEQEYMEDLPRMFLNQNGELIYKLEGELVYE